MNDTGSCSFAGLGERGSFLQLLSVESGFRGRAGTMALGTAGWHIPGSAGHCSPLSAAAPAVTKTLRPSVTLRLSACSHIAHRCTGKEAESACSPSARRNFPEEENGFVRGDTLKPEL